MITVHRTVHLHFYWNFQEEVTSVVLPCKQPSCVTNSNNSAEEDKIQEYLNRSDTAVIYPEPVSDPEAQEPEASIPETEEEEEENQDNGKCSSLLNFYFRWLTVKLFHLAVYSILCFWQKVTSVKSSTFLKFMHIYL